MQYENRAYCFSEPRPAVFLDRDGTLVEDVGVLGNPLNIRIFPDTIPALLKLQEHYLLFVITNQSAVAKGELELHQVAAVNQALDEMLSKTGVVIQEWYVCPHSREEHCSCIKPNPEFVLRAQNDYGLDLGRSFVIGDHPQDALTAKDEGVFGLYLLTGHGGRHLSDLPIDSLVFHRISDATEWILNHPDHETDLQHQIEMGAKAIRDGGVAAFPTETVYGLGADLFQPAAVEQIFTIKGRPQNNPLIAHIADVEQLHPLVSHVPDEALRLMDAFWPGPLSLVLPKRKEVPDIVTAGHETVAVRMPAHPIARDLIRRSSTPVVAPSANRFTCTSPTTARHVREQLGDRCGVIIDGGACRVGVESTVISFAGSTPVVLRPGGIPIEELERLIGKVETRSTALRKSCATESPGMMPNHYAPATDLLVFEEIPACFETQSDIGVLLFQPSVKPFEGAVEILSQSGDTKEAAANLFAALRRLDSLNLRLIVAEYTPARNLGNAINNRLLKAAGGRIRP